MCVCTFPVCVSEREGGKGKRERERERERKGKREKGRERGRESEKSGEEGVLILYFLILPDFARPFAPKLFNQTRELQRTKVS